MLDCIIILFFNKINGHVTQKINIDNNLNTEGVTTTRHLLFLAYSIRGRLFNLCLIIRLIQPFKKYIMYFL
jgi:hypothetical protein